MPLLQDRTAVFIVRLWWEFDETGRARTWRGSVEHVQSGRRKYFQRYDDLIAFVQQPSPDDAARSPDGAADAALPGTD